MQRAVITLIGLRVKEQWRLMLAVFCFLAAQHALAIQCNTAAGTPVNYDFNFQFASQQNYVGYTTGWNQKTDSGSYTISGGCNNRDTVYYTAQPGSSLSFSFSDGSANWYDIIGNDYLQVASQIYVYNASGGSSYHNVPFVDLSNNCNGRCGGMATTGSRVQVSFRIKRKFVGVTTLPLMPIFAVYGNQGSLGQGTGSPLVQGFLSGTMTVPQSCTLNAGQVISIDFGNISTGAFSTAGSKPDGVKAATRTIGIACNGIEAQTNLSLRVQADTASGNAIVSDNSDVGFVVTDSSSRPLTPNDLSSVLPFTLDDNASANVTITAYPVSVTGNTPEAGVVSALAYLRVDFD
ncbi:MULTISPECIES: fimbrial protein [unclassified Brenneria]|uniref:fimbrial protein n=1 Tax=unclassified Brenneria TaxID=2634434 RepID=UPI0029C399CA|nr:MULTISPECIES: fimbrial protein [unclassified Brenneria]MDX5627703.1 fimbrial protein [Brenneria sp. L3-3Z]MDX5695206.1 fimbrial protein [Brenneria sp. L4-2C]